MRLQWMLTRSELRRGWATGIALVLVVALGVGTALTSVEAASRTASAYPEYVDDARVADVVVNPVIANARTLEMIESVPGVRSVTSDSLLTAYPRDVDIAVEDPESLFFQARVSQDGRYLDTDRPVVEEGRMVRSGQEAFVSTEAAERLGIEVGEEVTVDFAGVNPDDPTSSDPGPILGQAEVRVVGRGTFADEVRQDEAFPSMRMLLTPEAAAAFDCLLGVPDPDDPRSSSELFLALLPSGCAMTYRYYALDVEGGPRAAPAIVDEIRRRFQVENARLPPSLRADDATYSVIPTFTEDDARSVRQSLSPAITSLRAFAAATALATVVASLVIVLRHLRRRTTDLVVWRGLGLDTNGRAGALAVVPAAALVAGVGAATLVAFVASPLGPVATGRLVEPHPGRALGPDALFGALVTAVALVSLVALVARRLSATAGRPSPRRSWSAWARRARTAPPLVGLGLQAALRGRDAVTAAAGAVATVAVVTGTLLFALGLGRLVDEPSRFGWPFDLVALANFGYGPVDLDAVAADLDRPEEDGWSAAVLSGSLSIDGEATPSVVARRGAVLDQRALVEGRLPSGAAEIALGVQTARDIDREVGDQVTVTSLLGDATATVSGLVVLPAVGPFQSDITNLATGAYLPGELLEATYQGAEETTGLTPSELADGQAALVAIDLAADADEREVADAVDAQVDRWDPSGFGLTFVDALRPATIRDLAAIRGLPSALAALFAAGMAVAMVAGLAGGTRARRHELAVVRALGATRRQRRSSVRIHVLATVTVGLALGLPLGIAAGRVGYRRFADDLGVATDVPGPALVIAAVAGTALLLALVTAEVLGRRAVAQRPVASTRS